MFKKFLIKNESSEVEEFNLKEFSLKVTDEATAFEKSELISSNGFVIDKSSSKRSGLSYLKDQRITNKINEEVKILLEEEKSKIYEDYKKQGYDEGFQAGVEDGKKSTIEESKIAIEGSLATIAAVVTKIVNINKNIVKNNEEDLINLIKLATEKFCLKEIELDEEFTKNLIKQTLENHTKEEGIKCLLSPNDFKNLSKFNKEIKMNSLPQEINFEPSDEVSDGGLIVELENGKIDKNIKTRFDKIWDALSSDGE